MRIAVLAAALLAASATAVAASRAAPSSDPTEVVKRHVEAFNRRDVDGFMETLAPGVIFWEYPADTVFAGAPRVRAHYTELFGDEDATELHAEVRERIVKERFVIDEERVTGLPGEDEHVSVIIYEVVDGKIRNAWFMN